MIADSRPQPVLKPKDYERIRARHHAVVLDVRTPAEFDAGHIPGALNLDLNAPDFTEKAKTLDRSRTYLVNCTAGVRGAKACDAMRQLQFPSLYNLYGGLAAWEHAGFKPERQSPTTNPIDPPTKEHTP